MKIFGFEITRAEPPQTRFLGSLIKVELSPGDVCVLMVTQALSAKEAERIRDVWRATVGDDVTLLVLDVGMKLGVLSPPQAQAVHERLADESNVALAISA